MRVEGGTYSALGSALRCVPVGSLLPLELLFLPLGLEITWMDGGSRHQGIGALCCCRANRLSELRANPDQVPGRVTPVLPVAPHQSAKGRAAAAWHANPVWDIELGVPVPSS